MTAPDWTNRTMWTGDNRDIMRGMNSESVDLIYLHCDPTASHYLKLLMDAVFGQRQFRKAISDEPLRCC